MSQNGSIGGTSWKSSRPTIAGSRLMMKRKRKGRNRTSGGSWRMSAPVPARERTSSTTLRALPTVVQVVVGVRCWCAAYPATRHFGRSKLYSVHYEFNTVTKKAISCDWFRNPEDVPRNGEGERKRHAPHRTRDCNDVFQWRWRKLPCYCTIFVGASA